MATPLSLSRWPSGHDVITRLHRALMVLDVVESVRLMEGDERDFIRRWRSFVRMVREQILPACDGRIRKSLGDGLMLEFQEPEDALHAALAMVRALDRRNRHCPPERRIRLRVAAHVAQYVADDLDIYGADVNLTARLAQWAQPGDLLVTEALRELLPPRMRRGLEALGPCSLRHVIRPVHAFRVPSGLFLGDHGRGRRTAAAYRDHPVLAHPSPAGRQLAQQRDALDSEIHVAAALEVLEDAADHLAGGADPGGQRLVRQ
jgi:class 3 adenylate cyclase